MQEIAPLNVLSTMLVLQIVLALTMMLGVAADTSKYSASRSPAVYILMFVSFILCLISIAFTEEFYIVWRPMMGDLALPTISTRFGKILVFAVNYATVILLISFTGRRHSPLMPILFLLPTTSIFLRDPPMLTLVYGVATAIHYLLFSLQDGTSLPRFMAAPAPLLPSRSGRNAEGYNAHRIVVLLCLAIALLIGYITRPAPIDSPGHSYQSSATDYSLASRLPWTTEKPIVGVEKISSICLTSGNNVCL